jgi:hypothetical protein
MFTYMQFIIDYNECIVINFNKQLFLNFLLNNKYKINKLIIIKDECFMSRIIYRRG